MPKTISLGGVIIIVCIVSLYGVYQHYFSMSAKLDRYVQTYADQGFFSGAVLVAKDGKILLRKAYGMANSELDVPNTVDTRFQIASISKPFTAMAIMQLQEMGKLSAQDPLSRYIPDYPNGDKITIHHLLSHTSGIPHAFGPNYKKESIQPYTLEERIALFKDLPLKNEPGAEFNYGDNNYVLLTYIIEKISGKTYEQFLQEHIFQPLGMHNSGCDDFKRIIKKRAAGYSVNMFDEVVNAPYLDMSFEVGAGMLYSTIDDMYRWDRSLYTEKLISQKTLDQLFTPNKKSYGYGWQINETPEGKIISHSGENPGVRALIFRNVDYDLCIIVLSNFQHTNVFKIAENLQKIVFGKEPVMLQKKTVAIVVDPKLYDQYIGNYKAQKGNLNFIITKEQNRLFVDIVGYEKYALYPETTEKFFLKYEDGSVTFVKDSHGKISSLIANQGGHDIIAAKVNK